MIGFLLSLLLAAVPSASTLFAGPVPVQRAAAPRGLLSADAEARWVPFESTAGNQIRFQAIANGTTVSAILDTGVSNTIVTPEFARAAGITASGSETGTAIGGNVTVGRAQLRSLAFSGLTLTDASVIVTALPIAAAGGQPVSLLVGADVLGAYALDIDFAARRFRLLPSGRMPFAGARAPLEIDPATRTYVTEVRLGGRRLRPMLLDTGDGLSVTLSAKSWAAAGITGTRTTDFIGFGLGGPAVFDLTFVPQLALGTLTARDVEVQVEPADGYSTRIGLAGRIGVTFLQRYRVLLDPAARQLVLQERNPAPAAPPRSTSGLLLQVLPDRLAVQHVMRGSPAAANGWRKGEAICAVNGAAVTPDYAKGSLGRWTVGPPGTKVALRLCDGAERVLTLASFY